jgi:CubicO group peptidase (beta-lactamase class C family)
MKKFGAEDIQRVRETVDSLVEQYHLPGLSIGVVLGQELAYAEGFGFADIEGRRPQGPNLRQRIGSITKTMVALCAMALVDEGRLSLDDRVVQRLPDVKFDGPADSLTVRHLLTHTGGIGEAPTEGDLADLDAILWSERDEVPGVPALYPNGIRIEVAPGTKWAYANHGFVLLGEIIARVEGEPIEEVLRRRIFEPLGMSDTDCLDRPHRTLTTGYHRAPDADQRELLQRAGRDVPEEETVDGHNIRGRYTYVRGRAAGAVQSTIPDMARYASALLRRGAGIVRPESFDAMTAPQWCPDERLQSIGLAFFRTPLFGRRTFGHGGGVLGGWLSMLTVLPEESLAVLVHANLYLDTLYRVEGRILQAVLNAPDQVLPSIPVDPAVLSGAPGVYEATPGRLTNFRIITGTGRIQIAAEGGRLTLHARRGPWKGGVRMLPVDSADPAFFVLDTGEPAPPCVALLSDQERRVTGLRFDRLVYMVRNDSVASWA